MIDIIIVGGGIAGLYCALNLSKQYKVVLFDERDYLGGRIITHKNPQYEIGAARFNTGHKLLRKLIKKYNMPTYKLNKTLDFLDKKQKKIIPDIQKVLNKSLYDLIQKSNIFSKSELQSMTFQEYCITLSDKKTTKKLIDYFGYSAEFDTMNAYDAIQTFTGDFNGRKNYYVLAEGLSKLCEKIEKDIRKNGGIIKKNTFVKNITHKGWYSLVKTANKQYITKRVIFAVKPHQLKNFTIFKPYFKEINSVKSIPLIRIYAQYNPGKEGVWFKGMNRTTTDSFLKHIIPINEHSGLIMISYADGHDCKKYFKNGKLMTDKQIEIKIQKELKTLFPTKIIPKPIYFKSHLWTEGVHLWKKNTDSDMISKKILNPLENIYVGGEGFSLNQGWIEGALVTANKIIKLLN